jgi:cell fate regulator YaaT (PSP1 superfamily)
LTDFRSVNTSAASLPAAVLNPKISGQCGKLKCCLNYELDIYMDALKGFPDFETKLVNRKGDAICQKQDIFKGLMVLPTLIILLIGISKIEKYRNHRRKQIENKVFVRGLCS